MKTNHQIKSILLATIIMMAATSCKKDNSVDTDATQTDQSVIASAQAIAVTTTATGDTVYIINTCNSNQHRESIAFSSLPSAVTTYLSGNYAGYTSQKAFTIEDASGTLSGYVVVIQYNGNPVGLKFDASGTFVSILEQREGGDIRGHGYHHGGRFDDRDGRRRDTIAVTSLPAAITSYFSTNYPQDTLTRAFKNRDSSITVLTVNNGAFATLFDASGNFVKRVQLPSKHGRFNSVELAALPAASQSYLSSTYPNFVFKHAYKIMSGTTVQGYVVFIDANGTKYAVEFDATGNFVRALTVR